MKTVTWLLLIASLAVNATLLAALAKRRLSPDHLGARESTIPSAQSRSASDPQKSAAKSAADTAARDGTGASTTAPSSRTLWERLASRDPATFAANLRAAGFPPGSVRGGIYALLRDLQTPERVKAVESVPTPPYWQHAANPGGSSEYAKEINRLWHERDRIMRSLFPEEQQAFVLRNQARYGPLSADKLEKLAALDRDYSEMRMQLMQTQSLSGLRMPWNAEQLSYLDQEKRRDVAAMLAPHELEEYELRTAPTAMALQRQLAAFNPTEQEFRALFRARAAFDEKVRATGGGYLSTAQGTQAQVQLAESIKSALSEARYADYQRATDGGSVAARGIAERLGLPERTADSVYRLQSEMRERTAAIQSNTEVPAAQRDQQLASLGEEAKQKLTALLTPAGVDQYRLQTGDRSMPILTRAGPRRR